MQEGVSEAFPGQSASQAPPPRDPSQQSPTAPQASTSSSASAAHHSSSDPAAAPSSSAPGAGPPGNSPRSSSPRLLWSEDAELAEARERCQWHEVMSRRNGGEHTEKLQVSTLLYKHRLHCYTLGVHLCVHITSQSVSSFSRSLPLR